MRHTGRMRTGRQVSGWLRAAALLAALGTLAGCGGTAVITLAGIAGDAISEATTGKSMIDAAMSNVTSKDCQVDRVLRGNDPCRTPGAAKPAPAVMAAAAPESMPITDVRFDGRDGRPVAWAPVAGGWVPLDAAANGEDGAAVEDLPRRTPSHADAAPSADAVIFAAAGSDERIDPEVAARTQPKPAEKKK